MIRVFCAKRGSGKTKRLIELANLNQVDCKGDAVYIDDDSRPIFQLSRGIRFVNTNEYDVSNCESFYGMICGILSSNYDIENIYIDGFLNIVKCNMKEAGETLKNIAKITNNNGINMYVNINMDNTEELPDCLREFVA